MLRQLLITVGMLFAVGLAQAGEAGRIVFVTGQATNSDRPLSLGDAVQEGDELVTGADGYIYLKTIDSGFLILRPGSRARIAAYQIDNANPANTRIKLELMNGVARSISGNAVKDARQNFRFNTPVAAIGVRGTDFTVFTNDQTSRVAVLSGGIVVSGFGGGCGPEGSGPCEGTTSRELFADQAGQLLQIQKGQIAPQLLRNSSMSPDVSAPPRKDEPVGKESAGKETTSKEATGKVSAGEYNLEPKKTDTLLTGAVLSPMPTPPAPPAPPAPPTTPIPPPVVTVPKSPEILWGRWEPVAELAPDSELLAKIKSGDYADAKFLGSFFLTRLKNPDLVLPREGRAAFELMASEAYLEILGKGAVSASVHNARLDVDFAAQSFATSLTVIGAGVQKDVRAKGDLTRTGELVGDLFGSNAAVRGYLGGEKAQEAVYLFKTNGSSPVEAFGATKWAR